MANTSKPAGLTPVRYLNGADWTGVGNIYFISSADGSAFYPGDLVKLSGTGDTTRGIPGISKSAAGDVSVGVLVAVGVNPDGGPYIDPNNLTLTNAPATKTQNYYALVVDDPNVIFEIEEISTGTALDATAIGLNANISVATPGTGGRYSASVVDNGTEATTATLNLKLLGLARKSDNAFGYAAKWLVLVNSHSYRVGTTGT